MRGDEESQAEARSSGMVDCLPDTAVAEFGQSMCRSSGAAESAWAACAAAQGEEDRIDDFTPSASRVYHRSGQEAGTMSSGSPVQGSVRSLEKDQVGEPKTSECRSVALHQNPTLHSLWP
jgi:hypothetical protein